MLVRTVKDGDEQRIGDRVRVIVRIRGGRVQLLTEAPRELRIVTRQAKRRPGRHLDNDSTLV